MGELRPFVWANMLYYDSTGFVLLEIHGIALSAIGVAGAVGTVIIVKADVSVETYTNERCKCERRRLRPESVSGQGEGGGGGIAPTGSSDWRGEQRRFRGRFGWPFDSSPAKGGHACFGEGLVEMLLSFLLTMCPVF